MGWMILLCSEPSVPSNLKGEEDKEDEYLMILLTSDWPLAMVALAAPPDTFFPIFVTESQSADMFIVRRGGGCI